MGLDDRIEDPHMIVESENPKVISLYANKVLTIMDEVLEKNGPELLGLENIGREYRIVSVNNPLYYIKKMSSKDFFPREYFTSMFLMATGTNYDQVRCKYFH